MKVDLEAPEPRLRAVLGMMATVLAGTPLG